MDEFGAELYSCPENLLVMFKRTLPQSIIDDLLDNPDTVTYEQILKFIRRRTDHRKEQILCDHAKKRIQGRSKASMNTILDEPLPQRDGYQDSTPSSAGSNIPVTTAGLRDMIDEQFAALKGKGKGKGDKSDTWVENRVCHNCDVKGHLSYQCPQPKRPRGGKGTAAAAAVPETPAAAGAAAPKAGRIAVAKQRPPLQPDADGVMKPKKTVLAVTPKMRLCPMTVKSRCANSYCTEFVCTDHLNQEKTSRTSPTSQPTTTNFTTRSALSEAFKAGTLSASSTGKEVKKEVKEESSQWPKTHK